MKLRRPVRRVGGVTNPKNTIVQPGMFGEGPSLPLTNEDAIDIIPLEYFKSHPSTRPWWSKNERANVTVGEIVETAIQMQDGFEGIIHTMTLTGKAGQQGANTGTGWRIFIDRAVPWQTSWLFGGSLDASGRFDYLAEGDGMGNSWGTIDLWVPEAGLVEVGMNNNGGTSDPMGWTMVGWYWPTILREQYHAKPWKGY